jgi:hypothetical protein
LELKDCKSSWKAEEMLSYRVEGLFGLRCLVQFEGHFHETVQLMQNQLHAQLPPRLRQYDFSYFHRNILKVRDCRLNSGEMRQFCRFAEPGETSVCGDGFWGTESVDHDGHRGAVGDA